METKFDEKRAFRKERRVLVLRWASARPHVLDQIAVRNCYRGFLFEVWNAHGGCAVHVGSPKRLTTFCEFASNVGKVFAACERGESASIRGRVGPGVSYYVEAGPEENSIEHVRFTTKFASNRYFFFTLFDFDSSYRFETTDLELAREWFESFSRAVEVLKLQWGHAFSDVETVRVVFTGCRGAEDEFC